MTKPAKPTPDFPLFAHNNGNWAKKIAGKTIYYGPWSDPQAALQRYLNSGSVKLPPLASSVKPAKPYPKFPLYPHSNGKWAKRILGKIHYFGRWEQPQAALDQYLRDKDDLHAGRVPSVHTGGLTVKGMILHFLDTAQGKVDRGEIVQRTYNDYRAIGLRIQKVFGDGRLVADLRPADFEKLRDDFASTHNLVALKVDITKSRVIFNFAKETYDIRIQYGQSFEIPAEVSIRRERSGLSPKFIDAGDIQAMIGQAGVQLRAMILLGINCGFGNEDCSSVKITHFDLDGGWHYYGRPKTGVERRCPLWPETVEAIRAALEVRPQARDPSHSDRAFLTRFGGLWMRDDDHTLSKETRDLMKELGCHRKGCGFYSLRHTFQTIGERSKERIAVSFIMGHAPENDDMAAVYRSARFEDDMLTATEFVRSWLMSPADQGSEQQDTEQPVVQTPPFLRLYADQTLQEPPPRFGSGA